MMQGSSCMIWSGCWYGSASVVINKVQDFSILLKLSFLITVYCHNCSVGASDSHPALLLYRVLVNKFSAFHIGNKAFRANFNFCSASADHNIKIPVNCTFIIRFTVGKSYLSMKMPGNMPTYGVY